MADFLIAYNRTARFEGGYVNDIDDKGGETYNGISRRTNPTWKGWVIIDEQKKKPNFPKNLDSRKSELDKLEMCFYRANYWQPVWGDEIQKQAVANDMYDTGVNMGVAMSIKLSERQWRLKETGRMSDELLTKLNSVK